MRPLRPFLAAVLAVASLVTVGAVAPVDEAVASVVPAQRPTAGDPPAPPPGPTQRVDSTFRPVAAAGPCLLVEGPAAIAFGRGEFGGPPVTATPTTTVRACIADASAVGVRASVTDATVAGAPAWVATFCASTPCPLAVDEFAYFLGSRSLTGTPVEIDVGQPQQHTLHLPPPGSIGGGSRVTMRVDFLGVAR